MYKVILTVGLSLLAILAPVSVSAGVMENDSLMLGNCEGRGVSMSGSNVTGGALYFPESRMAVCEGNYLESVWIYINAPASYVNSLKIFVSGSLDEPYDYVQQGEPARFGWNEVVLDTPYQLDGSALYIGFEIDGASVSYAARRSEGDEFSLVDGVWQPYTDIYSHAFYGVVRGDNLPLHDVALECRVPFTYAVTGEGNVVEATITNNGLATVESLDFTFDLGGGSISQTVEGLSIPYLESQRVVLDGLVFHEAGEYDVTLTVSAVNGVADLDMTDNTSSSYHYVCLDSYTPRNVLLEIYSTELCSNCPAAHNGIDNIVDGNGRIIEVGHHSGYYTDGLTVDASVEYEWFYGGHTSAPSILIDRTNRLARYPELRTYEDNNGPVMGVGNSMAGALDDALATPAYAEIDVQVSNDLSADYRDLTIDVTGRSLLPLPDDESVLYVFLTEDSIFTETQAGSGGSYYHRHSLRSCLSDTWGDAVDLAGGFTETYQFSIPDEWDMARMHVVAFVAHSDSEDYNDNEVYNTSSVALRRFMPQSSIADGVAADTGIIYDGHSLMLPGDCIGVDVCSLSGVRLLSSSAGHHRLSVEGLDDGVYIYVAHYGDRIASGKFVRRR